MRPFPDAAASLLLLLLSLGATALAADPETVPTPTACTATSPSGSFYDLRPDIAVKEPADGSKRSTPYGAPTADYHARGYDYGSNFTLNVCGAVVEPVDNVMGIDRGSWQNISAYYVSKGDVYSLGLQNGNLTARGRRLVLQYTGGSPCGLDYEKRGLGPAARSSVHEGAAYKYSDYDDDDDDDHPTASGAAQSPQATEQATTSAKRRKSATISFICNSDPVAGAASVSFIGTDPDECAYFFEVRTQNACVGVAEPNKPGSVGPSAVFGIILLIAVLVYLGGGIFYQRNVANARGWRQLPNYSLWASIGGFIYVRCRALGRLTNAGCFLISKINY